jgi:hypothetical protein
MKNIILILFLLICVPVQAETIIIPVQDLIVEVPNYQGPTFNLGAAGRGEYSIGNIVKVKRNKKQIEQKLIDIAWTYFSDAQSIKIYNGNFIIKCPET